MITAIVAAIGALFAALGLGHLWGKSKAKTEAKAAQAEVLAKGAEEDSAVNKANAETDTRTSTEIGRIETRRMEAQAGRGPEAARDYINRSGGPSRVLVWGMAMIVAGGVPSGTYADSGTATTAGDICMAPGQYTACADAVMARAIEDDAQRQKDIVGLKGDVEKAKREKAVLLDRLARLAAVPQPAESEWWGSAGWGVLGLGIGLVVGATLVAVFEQQGQQAPDHLP